MLFQEITNNSSLLPRATWHLTPDTWHLTADSTCTSTCLQSMRQPRVNFTTHRFINKLVWKKFFTALWAVSVCLVVVFLQLPLFSPRLFASSPLCPTSAPTPCASLISPLLIPPLLPQLHSSIPFCSFLFKALLHLLVRHSSFLFTLRYISLPLLRFFLFSFFLLIFFKLPAFPFLRILSHALFTLIRFVYLFLFSSFSLLPYVVCLIPIFYLPIGAPSKIYGCKTQLKMYTALRIEKNARKLEELKEKVKEW